MTPKYQFYYEGDDNPFGDFFAEGSDGCVEGKGMSCDLNRSRYSAGGSKG